MKSQRFFSGTPGQSQHPRRDAAPGTRIGYDPLLLQRFKADHRRMLGIFTQVQELLITRDYDGVKRKLGVFRILLQDHLMLASGRLYVYVARIHAANAEASAHIRACRQEMLTSSRHIMDFLRTYSAARLDDSFAEHFQAELLAMGSALVQRIEREESCLYPLYRPAS